MEGNNSSKYEHYQKLINIAKMCDEINSSKYENEKMIWKQISELTYKEKNNIDAIYSPLKGVTSVYPPKKH